MSIAAAALFSYVALASWFAPAVLRRIADRGINPRLGVTAWLTAVGSVLGAWIAALGVLSLAVVRSRYGAPVWEVCVELLGHVGHDEMDRPGTAAVALVLVVMAVAASATVGHRAGRTFRTLRARSRNHADGVRSVGSPTRWGDVVMMTAEQPAAYCVAGRPPTIVVTTAALSSLGDQQLAAVLAHERAHLAGRHHHVLMSLRAIASGLSRLPLFVVAPGAVARLLEMCADDAAVRRHGAPPLLRGLMTLVSRSPTAALGAADTAVLDRAARLAKPVARGMRLRDRIRLCAIISSMATAPVLAGLLCHH